MSSTRRVDPDFRQQARETIPTSSGSTAIALEHLARMGKKNNSSTSVIGSSTSSSHKCHGRAIVELGVHVDCGADATYDRELNRKVHPFCCHTIISHLQYSSDHPVFYTRASIISLFLNRYLESTCRTSKTQFGRFGKT